MGHIVIDILSVLCFIASSNAFYHGHTMRNLRIRTGLGVEAENLSAILTERFPTSVEDQIRQASESLKRASHDGYHRHSVRLLLPLLAPSDLDDWPGGARQMAEAAFPLMKTVLRNLGAKQMDLRIVDESDGIGAILAQADDPKKDSCTVLLPSADTIKTLQSLEEQVGLSRDMIIVNAQWQRKSDFGIFGGRDKRVFYAEKFVPSFYCSNLMVEGEQVRILRTYPGPWKVYLRSEEDRIVIWSQIGEKPLLEEKPATWDMDPANLRDGGRLFDFGKPAYREVETMIKSQDGFAPKSIAERASAAFSFIKDTI
jgi:Domain of unknown function (DUF1995)